MEIVLIIREGERKTERHAVLKGKSMERQRKRGLARLTLYFTKKTGVGKE